MQDGQSLAGRNRRVGRILVWPSPVDDIPHRQQQCSHRWNPRGVIDLGGIRQSECGRKPIVGSDRRLGWRDVTQSRRICLAGAADAPGQTFARWLADLTVDVRWNP